MDSQKRLDYLLDVLRERGNRLTPQRVAILRALVRNDNHPSAEQIHGEILRDFPTTSLATVYKTIALLKEIGEILELGFGDDGSRFDGRKPYPHPHLICTQCGAILDSEVDNFNKLIDNLASRNGFSVQTHRFDIFGLCSACNKN
ncbi:Fur family transcriptional regulator [Pseudodesulfovibrio portus]|uniref:Transcriptional repressor n=1 Tax=Pseudodesulfovibrio portus TaxID=231439 RepID=A0ABM8ATL1_9BACT|nr:transcriptional repressor [Pseudodesulfovibrio portus]BDQ34762.1 transcriptional repressor [Pseudodesulfovibrio portus]